MIRPLETWGSQRLTTTHADRRARDGAGHQQPAVAGAAGIRQRDRLGGRDAQGRDQAERQQPPQDAVARHEVGGGPEVGEEARTARAAALPDRAGPRRPGRRRPPRGRRSRSPAPARGSAPSGEDDDPAESEAERLVGLLRERGQAHGAQEHPPVGEQVGHEDQLRGGGRSAERLEHEQSDEQRRRPAPRPTTAQISTQHHDGPADVGGDEDVLVRDAVGEWSEHAAPEDRRDEADGEGRRGREG